MSTIDSFIHQGLKDWQIPGLAMVIVKDGKIEKIGGYGVKNINTKDKVDENTHFFIASNSKLFTGMAISQLHHEDKLSLNDKVTKYFPSFDLFEKTTTELVTIKDMLTHRIGTKTFQGDFTYWNSSLTSEEIIDKMNIMKPINGFRDAYGYCNSCYLVAGMMVPQVTDKTWGDYITQNYLLPLGMTNTYALSNDLVIKSKNYAHPYTTVYTNTLQEVPFDQWDNLAPAASIASNVKDLSKWLMFQIDSGKYEGKQVTPWKVLQTTRDVQIINSSRKSTAYPMHFRGYGLGVSSADYNGKQIFWHTGGAAGMVSNVCFVPEEKLGIAILTNNDNQNFFEILRYQILDCYLGMPYTDRNTKSLNQHNDEMAQSVKEINAWKIKSANAKDKTPKLRDFEGTYLNELYGKINVRAKKDYTLEVSFDIHPSLKAKLSYLENDEWLTEYSNIEYGIHKAKLTKNKDNKVSLTLKVNDFIEYDTYEFIKIK